MLGLFILSSQASALDYPFQANSQVIIDVTTVGMGQPSMPWRYELWLFGEREPGKFEAVWVFFNNPRQPQESMAGAIPLTISRSGAKQFPREREVTYILQEAIESFLPDLSGVSSFDAVWKGPATVTGRYFSYQPLGPVNGLVRCSFAQYGEDKMDQIVGVLTSGEAFFDPTAHWLAEIQFATSKQTPQGQQFILSQATARLGKMIQKDAAWSSKRREEARAFFVALQAHDDLLYKANDDLSSATITLSPIAESWQSYLDQNSASIFAPLGKSHTIVMQNEAAVLRNLWAGRKKVVGGGAPRWTLKDTTGKAVSLDSYPAKPMLLVLWSRYSWESLMALRELRTWQKELEPRGLVIVPINLDSTDQEAIDALATIGLNLATLRNTDPNLLTAYGIPLGVLPSAVVLDASKKIVDIRLGWGKRVFQELRQRIESAL
jgi:peroxiredoxin